MAIARPETRALAAGLALAVVFAVPGTGAAAPSGTARELDEQREDLAEARSGLADADATLETALSELDGIEARLDTSTEELRRLEDDAAEARARYDAARARTDRISEQLRDLDGRLETLAGDSEASRDRLSDHAATAYMHGGGARSGAMFGALLGASDLHDFSVGLRVVVDTLAEDGRLADRSRDLTVAMANTRRKVASLRADKLREEDAAQAAATRLQRLAQRQHAVTQDVARERDRRSEILARAEQDRATAAALVTTLEETTARLSAQLRRSIEVRWEEIEITGPVPDWADSLPADGQRWAPAIAQAAARAGIEPRLLAALVWAESNFHAGARSHVGAVGLAQLMPGTAAGLGVDPHDPIQNLAGGATYLAQQLARFGSVELALAAYNAGPGAVQRYGGIPPYAETRVYVVRVLRYYERLTT